MVERMTILMNCRLKDEDGLMTDRFTCPGSMPYHFKSSMMEEEYRFQAVVSRKKRAYSASCSVITRFLPDCLAP
jgi:hypothetical protein